jgi:hypothetical protein
LNGCGKFLFDEIAAVSYLCKAWGNLQLTDYLSARESSDVPQLLNSEDCAAIIAIEGLACGIDVACCTMYSSREEILSFNSVYFIGATEWITPFLDGGVLNHTVATFGNELLSPATLVFDASLELDGGDYPGLNDSAHTKTRIKAANLPFAPSVSQMIDAPTDRPYTGHFYRERLLRNGSKGEIGEKFYMRSIDG